MLAETSRVLVHRGRHTERKRLEKEVLKSASGESRIGQDLHDGLASTWPGSSSITGTEAKLQGKSISKLPRRANWPNWSEKALSRPHAGARVSPVA
jgi:hypothetical protein